eukprot:752461-Hanusia_phi.AAC.2
MECGTRTGGRGSNSTARRIIVRIRRPPSVRIHEVLILQPPPACCHLVLPSPSSLLLPCVYSPLPP